MTGAPRASVVIRTLNEAESLGKVLDLLAAQTIGRDALEVIVVDSGSSDGTVEIARAHGARVIEITPQTFTFGRALNIGAAAAAAPVVVALSGHAFPRSDDWVALLLACFQDERVACASGAGAAPEGGALTEAIHQDEELARRFPRAGYSNSGGAFRADLWSRRPFREDMPGTEDKEWAWYWLQRGFVVALDPALQTDHDHSRDPPRDCYRRARIEWRGYRMYLDLPPMTVRELIGEWWRANATFKSHFNPSVLATWAGEFIERRSRRP